MSHRAPAQGGLVAARCFVWVALPAALAAAHHYTRAASATTRMLALAGAAAMGLKAIVAVEEYAAGAARPQGLWWLAFLLGWPGARPSLFAARCAGGHPLRPLPDAAACLLLGLLLRALAPHAGWGDALHLLSLSLVVHMGLLGLLTMFWRGCGIPCPVLFHAPWRAASLSEFWGRRWNRAFSDAATLAIARPLRGRVGQPAAVALVFLFSGLLHEAVLSLPVRAGFGGPTLYFLVQAGLVERERRGGITTVGWQARLRTGLSLLVPLPLLFPPAFVHEALAFWTAW